MPDSTPSKRNITMFKKLFSWKPLVVDTVKMSLKVLAFAWQTSAKRTSLLLLFLVISSSLPATSAFLLNHLVNDVVALVKTGTPLEMTTIVLGIGCILCNILPFIINPASDVVRSTLSDLLIADIDEQVMKKASQLTGLAYFDESEFYDQLRFLRENSTLLEGMLWVLSSTISNGITLISLLSLTITISPFIPIAMVLVALPHLFAEYRHHQYAFDTRWEQLPESRQLGYFHGLLFNIESVKEIKLFNLGAYFINRYRELFDTLFKRFLSVRISHTKITLLFTLLHGIGLTVLYIYVVLIAFQGKITVGEVAMYFSIVNGLQAAFWQLTLKIGNLTGSTIEFHTLSSFFELAPTVKTGESAQAFSHINRTIEFRNISFRYPGRENTVFSNVSFSVNAGETLAIVGENGAGKTTLIKLLCRFYDPTEGQIFIDDVPLHQYRLESLRQKIAPVFQDFSHFFLTAGENIGIGNVEQINNESAVIQAAEQGQADTVVSQLSDGYETLLGRHFDGGTDLSGGEWQKIAISRAFMRDAQILILDEPTAALDAESEYALFQRFKTLTQGVTTLLISHRFSTVRMADRILLIDEGKILEEGTHEQLMNKGGRYATLYRMQSEKYQ